MSPTAFLPRLWHPEQCLVHSRCSINMLDKGMDLLEGLGVREKPLWSLVSPHPASRALRPHPAGRTSLSSSASGSESDEDCGPRPRPFRTRCFRTGSSSSLSSSPLLPPLPPCGASPGSTRSRLRSFSSFSCSRSLRSSSSCSRRLRASSSRRRSSSRRFHSLMRSTSSLSLRVRAS